MRGKRINRWDVQVVFPKFAFGIKSRSDVTQTPETVVEELEEFCRRVRTELQRAGELSKADASPSVGDKESN